MTERLSLTELQLIIRDTLYMALPDMYWVVAEISEIKENYAGHCYLELIEKLTDENNPRAKVRAIIWNKRYLFLKSLFENVTGEYLKEGMKVLVRVKIEYHELYGLSLIISDIDPSFTLGEMALKRQMIIKRLEDDGVLTMNKELPFPPVPQRIAVVSSKSAAGYTDFINHLDSNIYGYVFYPFLFETTMQGKDTEKSVLNALDRIAGHTDKFDVVVIIRGGGSQSDLSWFDSYNIAYHVTQFPLPVITGIGHEKDLTVTDLVANRSLKTPTAVAGFLIESIAETESMINEISREISELSKMILEDNRIRIETSKMRLIPLTRLMISGLKEELSENIMGLISSGKALIMRASMIPATQISKLVSDTNHYSGMMNMMVENKCIKLKERSLDLISKNTETTSGLYNRLKILDPSAVIKRGFTITSLKGIIIKSYTQADKDDIIETLFADGRLYSKVMEKKNDKRNKRQINNEQ